MSTITWHEELPSDASQVAISPPNVRSHWTSTAVGLGESLFWAGSGGASQLSSGELRPGSTRAYIGTFSQSSNAAANLGKIFFSSDSSFVYLYESDRTHKIGGPGTVSQGSSAFGAVWIEQRGSFSADEGDNGPISYTTAYDAPPFVWACTSKASTGASGDAWIVSVISVSVDSFYVSTRYLGGGTPGPDTVYWTSLGTRSTGEF